MMRERAGIKGMSENQFLIAPKPGGRIKYAKADKQSIYGKVACGWEKTKEGYRYTVTLPSNTTARLILPDGREKMLSSGTYQL